MDNNANQLLSTLDGEINKKCSEIKHKRQMEIWQKLFVVACALFVIVPVLLVFAGIDLHAFFIPATLFTAVSFMILSPILLSGRLEGMEP